MKEGRYGELQQQLMLLGNLLPEVDELQEMLDSISILESALPIVYMTAPIPAGNLAPGYDRMRALAGYIRAIIKARGEFEEVRKVVLETEVRILRGGSKGPTAEKVTRS